MKYFPLPGCPGAGPHCPAPAILLVLRLPTPAAAVGDDDCKDQFTLDLLCLELDLLKIEHALQHLELDLLYVELKLLYLELNLFIWSVINLFLELVLLIITVLYTSFGAQFNLFESLFTLL